MIRTSPVGRRELLVRLTALADETRLQMLQLFADGRELGTQEMMSALGLSQSRVSRHLSQLRSAGFVRERRGEGALKHYHHQPQEVEATFRALQRLLSNPTEAVVAEERVVDAELRTLVDEQDRLLRWPTKQRERQAALRYMAGRFEAGRRYTEREVNDLLNEWHTFGDPVTMRRELVTADLLRRERNGSSYWLAE